jgi:DNA-binding HxlR family transcriptional regulator
VNDPLPLSVRHFIAHQIESVAQLETLLLLRRESQRLWNARELSQRLYLSEKMCQVMLNDLERRMFLTRASDGDSVRYECTDATTDAMIASLEELYRERRVAVISEIHSTPISKVQTFADAFRIRKDGKT